MAKFKLADLDPKDYGFPDHWVSTKPDKETLLKNLKCIEEMDYSFTNYRLFNMCGDYGVPSDDHAGMVSKFLVDYDMNAIIYTTPHFESYLMFPFKIINQIGLSDNSVKIFRGDEWRYYNQLFLFEEPSLQTIMNPSYYTARLEGYLEVYLAANQNSEKALNKVKEALKGLKKYV